MFNEGLNILRMFENKRRFEEIIMIALSSPFYYNWSLFRYVLKTDLNAIEREIFLRYGFISWRHCSLKGTHIGRYSRHDKEFKSSETALVATGL